MKCNVFQALSQDVPYGGKLLRLVQRIASLQL